MLGELLEWLANLDGEFAFLLVLPFAVAAAGLLAELRGRRSAPKDAPEPGGKPVVPNRHAWGR